jgi:hypothetical protein
MMPSLQKLSSSHRELITGQTPASVHRRPSHARASGQTPAVQPSPPPAPSDQMTTIMLSLDYRSKEEEEIKMDEHDEIFVQRSPSAAFLFSFY